MTVFGDTNFEETMKVKWGCMRAGSYSNMTDDHMKIGRHTRDAHRQRKGYVRMQQDETIYKPRRKSSGDIKTTDTFISHF